MIVTVENVDDTEDASSCEVGETSGVFLENRLHAREVEDGKIPEWSLIEFQGKFSCNENEEKTFFSKYVGDLNYTKDGIPFFLNGHHIMYGEEVKLKRPLAILHRSFEDEGIRKRYVVKAVIRKKILFVKRPKPIIPHEIPINND